MLGMVVSFATANTEHGAFDKGWMATGPAILGELVDIWRLDSSARLFDTVRALLSTESFLGRESYLESLRAMVGNESRVLETFESVDVEPVDLMSRFVRHGSSHLSYKRTETHYPNFKSNIYRRTKQS